MNGIPVLAVRGRSLAEAYERALVALHREGARIRTQYDKPDDPPSLDATMNLTVEDPLAEPMIHKAFPGGLADLREYVYELEGLKDSWVKAINDPSDTRWEYTYHGRLHTYGQWKERRGEDSVFTGPFCIDQIERVVDKLCRQPYTRQAQMITWMPNLDLDCFDPPCLQSLWYRITDDGAGGQDLSVNVRFRSNDAWGANFMNMFGFTIFNRDLIAAAVAKRSGRPTRLARMNWQADSYHIYGKDVTQAEQRLFDRLATTAFEDRVLRFDDPAIYEMYHEQESEILRKIAEVSARMR
jgi:thymidylate synthase